MNCLWLLLPFFLQQPSYCEVYGTMHEVYNARQADLIVFEEESEAFADLVVYDQDNRFSADRSGHWHFVKRRERARYTIYFTKNRDKADFTVYFTDTEAFAGCR